jgi:hypothetical protein
VNLTDVRENPYFCGNRNFITVFMKVLRYTSCRNRIRFTPSNTLLLTSVLILSFYLRDWGLLTCKYFSRVRGRIQKFPDWPPGARTANSTALCHYVQLYRYFVSQSSEFCRHNPSCCFSTSVYCCLFRYRLSPETFGYTFVSENFSR